MVSPTRQFFIDIRRGVPRRQAFSRLYNTVRARAQRAKIERLQRAKGGRVTKSIHSRPPGPLTKEGKFYSKPERRKEKITKTITPVKQETVDEHVKGKFYTKTAYIQYTEREYKKGVSLYQSIDPKQIYIVEGKPVLGFLLRQRIQRDIITPGLGAYKQAKDLKTSEYVYDIKRTDKGFQFYNLGLKETGPSLSGFGSFFLHAGERAYASLTGSPIKSDTGYVDQSGVYHGPTPKEASFLESRDIQQMRLGQHKQDIDAFKSGDVGYYAKAILSNPYTLAFISGGLAYASTGLSYSAWGSKAFIGSPYVTRGTAIQSYIGGATVGYSAGSVSRTYQERGIVGARQHLGQMLFYSPVALGGYQVGQYYGYGLPQKVGALKTTFNKAYSTFVPRRIQSTFGIAKAKVTKFDPWFFRRHTPKFIKTYFSRASPKSVFSKYKNIKTSYISKKYAKDLDYYGPELYPYARRAGLVKPRGMYKLGEIDVPYKHYGSYSGFKWPERDIEIMPHRVPTRTYTYMTPKGVKVVSVAKDMSSVSTYTVKPLSAGKGITESMGLGKKGGIISRIKPSEEFTTFIQGRTLHKVYTSRTGPYSIIPSIRELRFHGIVKSWEIPTSSGEITGIFSRGSFNISRGVSGSWNVSTTFPSFIKARDLPYSFGGRLFRENLLTETRSFTRQLDSSMGIPGKYGFKTMDIPKTELTYSYGKFSGVKGYGYSKDISITLTPKPKTTPVWESFAADARGLGGEYFVKSPDLITLPGGLGGGLRDTSLMSLIKNQFSGLGALHRYGRVSYIDTTPMVISNFWRGTAPSMGVAQQNIILNDIRRQVKPVPLISLPKLDMSNVTGMITDTRRDLIRDMRIDTRQLTETLPIQKQIQQLTPISIQALKITPITITPTITTPITITPTITLPPPPTIVTPPTTPLPPTPLLPSFEEDERKIYAEFKFKPIDLGYRYRKWKTPKLEDILNIKI